MKKLTQSIVIVSVTTLCITAFTTSTLDHRNIQATVSDSQVTQVVITGKRMTALEKAQFDAGLLPQSTKSTEQVAPPKNGIAVK